MKQLTVCQYIFMIVPLSCHPQLTETLYIFYKDTTKEHLKNEPYRLHLRVCSASTHRSEGTSEMWWSYPQVYFYSCKLLTLLVWVQTTKLDIVSMWISWWNPQNEASVSCSRPLRTDLEISGLSNISYSGYFSRHSSNTFTSQILFK